MSDSVAAQERADRLAQTPLLQVGSRTRFFTGSWFSITQIVRYRELLLLLIRRELRARYKDSTLGFAWSLAKPVMQLAIYALVLGELLQMSRGVPQFAIYVFCGLTLWTLFNEIVSGGTGAVVANAGLVRKIYLPREVFPLSAVGGASVNFGIQFLVLLAATFIFGEPPLLSNTPYTIAAVVLILVFGTTIAVALSAINVYLRDVQHLVEIFIMVLFWASPIVYSFKYVHEYLGGNWLEQLYLSNPVTIAALSFQRGMWTAGADMPFPADLDMRLLISLGVSVLLLWLAQRLFARLDGNFAQEL